MHRQTIQSYDAGAERWRSTRRADASGPTSIAAAAFRQELGAGLALDLGCGPGAALTALGEPAIGLDASLGMLALASARDDERGAPLVAGDLEALPLVSGCAAGAFGSFSFQHLPRDQFVAALRETARVLRPGGLLELWMHGVAGVDGVRTDDDMGIGRWFTYWSREELASAVPTAGFEVLDIEDLGPARRTRARRPA